MPEPTQEEINAEEIAIRAEVAAELDAEDSGEYRSVDADNGVQAEEEVAEIKAVDPWAGVDPKLKEMFDGMKGALDQATSVIGRLEPRLKQAESRIGSFEPTIVAARKAKEAAANAPTKEQLEAAAASEEKWKTLVKDFPEWGEAFDGRLSKKIDDLRSELSKPTGIDNDTLKAELNSLQNTVRTGSKQDVQLGFLEFFHPDWSAKRNSPKFNEWIKVQPKETIAKFESDFAKDAIDVLDAYDTYQGSTETPSQIVEKRKQRLKGSILPAGQRAVVPKSEADMSPEELRAKIGREVFAEP